MVLSTFRPSQSQQANDSLLMRIFASYQLPLNIYFKPRQIKYKKKHCSILSEKVFSGSFSTSSRTFSEFGAGNTLTLEMYLIKITMHPSFTRLRIVRQINSIHKMQKFKMYYKDSVMSPSHLYLLGIAEMTKKYLDIIALI